MITAERLRSPVYIVYVAQRDFSERRVLLSIKLFLRWSLPFSEANKRTRFLLFVFALVLFLPALRW